MKWMLLGSMLLLWASSAAAQTTAEEEYSKRIRAATTVEPLTHESFGAQVNLYNGSTEFAVVDVSLPGNDALPVEVRRHLPLEDRSTFKGALGGFGDWSLDVPYVHGLFAEDKGWKITSGDGYSRCSVAAMPDTSRTDSPSAGYSPLVWDGYQLNIPGSGSQELLVSTVPATPSPSTGGPYPWLTKDHYRVSCLPAARNYPGEAFVVLSPHGVKYTLDHAIVKTATSVSSISRGGVKYHPGGEIAVIIPRSRIYFVATKAEDRFGNTVEYHYDQDELRQITSSDGRSITLNWSGGKIASITSAVGTWNYAYRNGAVPYGLAEALDVVTRPDNSQWQYTAAGDLKKGAVYREDSAPPLTMCQHDLDRAPSSDFFYTVRAPWGAQVTYRFAYTRHWRTYIPTTCVETLGGPRYPDVFGVFHQWSLQSLQVVGPGLAPMTWTYHYDTVEGTMYYRAPWPEPNWQTTTTYVPGGNCATCRVSKTVLVKGPTETMGYEFGIQYARNEGRLLSTSTATPDGANVLRTVTHAYLSEGAVASQPFPDNVGKSLLAVWQNPMVARVRPVVSITTSQDGVNAVRSHQSFDAFARPLSILKSNAQRSRTDTVAYHDDLARWVLGQVSRSTVDGYEEQRTTYGWMASPTQVFQFGKLKQTLTYNTDGTIASIADGNNNITTLSGWKRGVSQSIRYPATPESPAGATESAIVNDAGWITRAADENGFTTDYGYDAMGRLASITYPVGDSTAWNSTAQVFEPVGSDEFGLPAGHWRQMVSTGNARKITYYDALWRPVLLREHDVADIAGTQRFNVSAYDAAGRQIFASYPVASLGSVMDAIAGTRTTYDVLGRVRVVSQNSEHGVLDTATVYLAGGATRVTDPKGNVTTTGYQFFDEIEFDRPLWIEHPGNIRTDIARDSLGRPLSIGRSGPDG